MQLDLNDPLDAAQAAARQAAAPLHAHPSAVQQQQLRQGQHSHQHSDQQVEVVERASSGAFSPAEQLVGCTQLAVQLPAVPPLYGPPPPPGAAAALTHPVPMPAPAAGAKRERQTQSGRGCAAATAALQADPVDPAASAEAAAAGHAAHCAAASAHATQALALQQQMCLQRAMLACCAAAQAGGHGAGSGGGSGGGACFPPELLAQYRTSLEGTITSFHPPQPPQAQPCPRPGPALVISTPVTTSAAAAPTPHLAIPAAGRLGGRVTAGGALVATQPLSNGRPLAYGSGGALDLSQGCVEAVKSLPSYSSTASTQVGASWMPLPLPYISVCNIGRHAAQVATHVYLSETVAAPLLSILMHLLATPLAISPPPSRHLPALFLLPAAAGQDGAVGPAKRADGVHHRQHTPRGSRGGAAASAVGTGHPRIRHVCRGLWSRCVSVCVCVCVLNDCWLVL